MEFLVEFVKGGWIGLIVGVVISIISLSVTHGKSASFGILEKREARKKIAMAKLEGLTPHNAFAWMVLMGVCPIFIVLFWMLVLDNKHYFYWFRKTHPAF